MTKWLRNLFQPKREKTKRVIFGTITVPINRAAAEQSRKQRGPR